MNWFRRTAGFSATARTYRYTVVNRDVPDLALMLGVPALGVGIAGGAFSVGVAYVSKFYPKERQGTALGIFGAGNVGSAVTKFVAPFVMVAMGWQAVAQIWAGTSSGLGARLGSRLGRASDGRADGGTEAASVPAESASWRDGDLGIPESGNGIPDILDEAIQTLRERRKRGEISFWRFLRYGSVVVLASMVISTAYLWLRYLA